jgi:hypothetical protein
MKNFLLIFLFATLNVVSAHAQVYTMANTSVTTCSGTFYDSGGAAGNYGNSENLTMTFTSGNGNRLTMNFSQMALNSGDVLFIYDGPTTAHPLIGIYAISSTLSVTSSETSLTFLCTTNSSSTNTGWVATITCAGPALTAYNMSNGTITACSGVFYDNGGAASNYTNNQNLIQTFCSGTTDRLQFTFNNNIFASDLSIGDSLFVYDGNSTTAPPLAIFVNGSNYETITSSGTCITFRLKSNASTNSFGWAAQFQCVSSPPPQPQAYNMSTGVRYVCNALFYDNSGPSANYSLNLNITQTFTSYNGERLAVNFSQMALNSGAVLYIYDGPTTSHPLIGIYATSPTLSVTSSGTSLTFVCITNSSTINTGWAASITCAGPVLPVYNMSNGTITACSGAFYDSGGATANYANNLNLIQTFCSGTTDRLQFTFNNNIFATDLNFGDSLIVYDGNSISAPPLAVFVNGSNFETITSSGTCITFRFKSNATFVSYGWAAQFQCVSSPPPQPQAYNMSTGVRYVCNALFYDNSGPSANYSLNLNITQTFTSYNGERLAVNFSQMALNSGAVLYIYDGPTTSHPLIGIYATSPTLSVTSSGTSLTFVCITNSSTINTGWAASITCAGPVLPVYNMSNGTITACSGMFYDNGGAAANYTNNQNLIQTICSGTTDRLQFTFNNNIFATDLSIGDSLFVYDGNSISAPPLAIFVNGSEYETITSSGTCITFRMKSNASGNSLGWAAQFQCVSSPAPSPQLINLSTGVRYVCNAAFYDNGGPNANYSNNLNNYQTFTSYNGNRITATFGSLNMSLGDYIAIYDGPSAAYPLIGTYATTLPPVITSSGSSLTFYCYSTPSSTSAGWDATITCAGPVLPVYNMSNGTVTACSGVFYDNGGAGANYTDNQNLTQTFCSGTSDHIQFSFNNLPQSTNLSAGDTLFVYDGATTSAPPLAILVSGSQFETFTSSGTCLTFRFKSNASGNNIGWAGQFQCVTTVPSPAIINMSTGVRYVCNAVFYDDGGANANYSNNLNNTQTITSYNGERLTVTFGSLNMSLGDYIAIYDGPSAAYPLIGTYATTLPPVITSSGSSLTFYCYSTPSSTSAGWDAAITCAGPVLPVYNMSNGTVTACSGVFYDNGGAGANYTDNQNLTQTFCSGTSDHIQFSFNNLPQSTNLAVGDTLFVYDGATTSAPPLAILVNGSQFETFTSSGTCLTFRFKSNASGNNIGWAGQFQCVTTVPSPALINMSTGVRYVCNAVFYDDGGPNANYTNSLNIIQTLTSYNGERLTMNFGSMSMSLGDYISIYDGPSTAYPLIGSYATSIPPAITSSGSSLTILCFTTSSANSSGWDATVTCAGPVLPVYNTNSGTVTTCSGVFYDNGGAAANYPNNNNSITTFTSANGQYLKFDFNPNHFNIAIGDSLYIYDGPTTASPLFAILTGNVAPGSITSNTSSLTFRFVSNATTNDIGWQALISCVAQPESNPQISMHSGVRYTCGGTFYDIGGPNANYLNNENRTMSFYSNSGCGIRFVFNTFNLSLGDVLYVHDGPSTASPVIATLSGSSLPAPVQSTGNVLTFLFTSTPSANSIGWSATISCPNQPLATITAGGPLSFCPGGNVTLTTAPNSTYLWNTGATTQSITVGTSGSYWVTVTNANNCTATSNIISVNANGAITANITAGGPLTFCQGGSVTLTASGGSSYVWSNNATGNTLNVTQSGNYYAIASSGTCIDTTSVIAVTVNPLPLVTLVLPQDSFCTNQPSASVLGGGSPAGGVWNGPGVSGNLFTPAVAGPGLHTIAYTYTDANGCSNTAAQVVFVDVCNEVGEITGSSFSVYPNPAQQLVFITLGNMNNVAAVELFDMAGRLILRETVNNRTQIPLAVAELENGVYLIRAGDKQVKFVKE